ncbi:MAG: hypothetical protein DMG14_06580 [Acidobacteria bacterium]|nr:MAG: hypothetical protein DMG14_06580 [Acidobacteriota bacterium]
MDVNKPEEGTERQNSEKLLPRGLEHVSQLFISRPQAGRVPIENSPNDSGDPPLTMVLRSCGFPVREQVLSLLKRQTGALEEGMKGIDANIPCDTSGSIEVLALDSRNQLAIIDFDDHPNDALLLRGIDHFDWVVRNIPNVRRMYQGQAINFAVQPRVFLVAPEFSPLFRSVARHITFLQIDCLKYHAIAVSGGVGIFLEHVFRSAFQHQTSL